MEQLQWRQITVKTNKAVSKKSQLGEIPRDNELSHCPKKVWNRIHNLHGQQSCPPPIVHNASCRLQDQADAQGLYFYSVSIQTHSLSRFPMYRHVEKNYNFIGNRIPINHTTPNLVCEPKASLNTLNTTMSGPGNFHCEIIRNIHAEMKIAILFLFSWM